MMTGTLERTSTGLSSEMKLDDERFITVSIAACISADSNTTDAERACNIITLKNIVGSGKCNEVQKRQALDGLALLIKEFTRG